MNRSVELSLYYRHRDSKTEQITPFYQSPEVTERDPIIRQTINALASYCKPCPKYTVCKSGAASITKIDKTERVHFAGLNVGLEGCTIPVVRVGLTETLILDLEPGRVQRSRFFREYVSP